MDDIVWPTMNALPELISAIVEMKRRNASFGYQRIADQISLVFATEVDKDLVRRVLARHYRPEAGSNGPSWLTFLGHSKDSLWSVDLFRCESLILKSHWIMVVMDQFSRRIIGFAVHAGVLDGPTVCRLFNNIVGGSKSPRYLSSERTACPQGTMTRFSDFTNGTPISGFSRSRR